MICDNDQRRSILRARRNEDGQMILNGLDYVEVTDDSRTLLAYFIGRLPEELQSDRPQLNRYLRVEGGRRVRDIRVVDVDPHLEEADDSDDYLIVALDREGDASTYTLRLVNLEGIDPRYDHADFSFKVDCAADLDCALPESCPPPLLDEPEISYLAKDYASFRQLILDRLALILPDWQERHIPDLGITLVELLAYVGDHLSYYQDAVATEAYLDTARQRISVRRHTRLVDYFLHEGCNARTWLALSIYGVPTFPLDLSTAKFLAVINSEETSLKAVISPDEFRQLPVDSYEVFEALNRTTVTLYQAHNEIRLYTWGQRQCCLPIGTRSASLLDTWVAVDDESDDDQEEIDAARYRQSKRPNYQASNEPQFTRTLDLKPGDVLVFEEVVGPKTGNPADADPTHRIAVCLTQVTLNEDPVVLTDGRPTPVVDIEWAEEDALPFALCISAVTDAPECRYLDGVSVARGNIILVDHGRTLESPEYLGTVPLERSEAICECEGQVGEVRYYPGYFSPTIEKPELTFRQPLQGDSREFFAKLLIQQDPRATLPQIQLVEVPGVPNDIGGLTPPFKLTELDDMGLIIGRLRNPQDKVAATLCSLLSARTLKALNELGPDDEPPPSVLETLHDELLAMLRYWEPRIDLLGSGPDDLHFVVEIDNEGVAHLRFGNNDLGEQASAGSAFYAEYRVGNGKRGNLGAETIEHIVYNLSGADLRVRNPLAAVGGRDSEPIADAKLYAPYAFRKQLERAIIAEDYAIVAQREFPKKLQRATARLAWTGSWYDAEVALDLSKSQAGTASLVGLVSHRLENYRRMGHDLHVQEAQPVPLAIELMVCVKDSYLRGHVKAVLLEQFSNRVMSDGTPGFFHPDRLTFGEDIYLSAIVAEAQAVEGVASVEVTKLQRLFEAPNREIENGVLPLGPFEIAQVENDRLNPELGQLTIIMGGGR